MKFLELSKKIEDLELEALACVARAELVRADEFDPENYDLVDAVVEFLSADTMAARQRKHIQRFYRETGYYAAHVGGRLVLGKKWIDGLAPVEARQKFVEEQHYVSDRTAARRTCTTLEPNPVTRRRS